MGTAGNAAMHGGGWEDGNAWGRLGMWQCMAAAGEMVIGKAAGGEAARMAEAGRRHCMAAAGEMAFGKAAGGKADRMAAAMCNSGWEYGIRKAAGAEGARMTAAGKGYT
jgi:hypothetical protein